jgi:hypothetical protein
MDLKVHTINTHTACKLQGSLDENEGRMTLEALVVPNIEAEVFHRQELLDAVLGQLLAQSRVLEASKGGHLGAYAGLVDPDHAVLYVLSRFPRPRQVL